MHWLSEAREKAHESTLLILVGTKIDLQAQRTIPRETILEFAVSNGLPYFEVSSKTGQGVDSLLNYSLKKRLCVGKVVSGGKVQSKGAVKSLDDSTHRRSQEMCTAIIIRT